tara:strand:+ start:241 stop:465 length:225 start_codon:yes stop_codon:yes gene_type:complete
MNDLQAIQIIEGMHDLELICSLSAESENQIIEAYQHLVDTGTVWHLQGSYARTAVQLLETGHVIKNYKGVNNVK